LGAVGEVGIHVFCLLAADLCGHVAVQFLS